MTSEIPDEVKERLTDLEGQVRALHNAREYLLEQVEELEEENAELREQLDDVEQTATTAYGLAGETSDGARADGGGPSKQKRAELLSRNEVVRRAITGNGDGGAVTVSGVKQMARPETKVGNKQVYRAWEKLDEKWPALEYNRREDKLNRLQVNADDLTEDLVRVVERDLDRDDLVGLLNQRRHRDRRA
jgi:regulator of replication initiation timing